MKLIEVIADVKHRDALARFAEQHSVLDYWFGNAPGEQRCSVRMLVDNETRQTVLDPLQSLLGSSSDKDTGTPR